MRNLDILLKNFCKGSSLLQLERFLLAQYYKIYSLHLFAPSNLYILWFFNFRKCNMMRNLEILLKNFCK